MRGFLFTIAYYLPIDLASSLYVLSLDLEHLDHTKKFWFRVARYHGFSVGLSLLFLHAAVCSSLLTLISRLPFIYQLHHVLLAKCNNTCSLIGSPPYRAHVLYAVRFMISSIMHTLVHITVTHPVAHLVVLRPQLLSGGLRTFWFEYRWTWSGYFLLLLLVFLLVSGIRLLRFAKLHVPFRMTHSALHLITLIFMSIHSSNLTILALLWILSLLEFVSFFALVRQVAIESLVVYRDDIDSEEVVLDIEFVNPPFYSFLFRAGDCVRVYVPEASWFEWHTFSVVPHLYDPSRSRLLIRTVGRWTRALYHSRKKVVRLWVHGPLNIHRDIPSLLRPSKSEMSLSYDPTFQICLVCSGISITRQLAFLVYLAQRYCDMKTYSPSFQSVGLPASVKLVWVVRHSFDINLAIRVLDEIQACLHAHGWQNLLVYDIHVSHEPNLDERAVNSRLRSFLISNEAYSKWRHLLPPSRPDSSDELNTNVHVSIEPQSATYTSDVELFLAKPPAGNQLFVLSRDQAKQTQTSNTRFSRFYSVLQLQTGHRVKSWLPIVRVQNDSERIDWHTLVVLTTGVKRIREELVRVCANSKYNLELCVEELW